MRKEITALTLAVALSVPIGAASFQDVPEDAWYAGAVEYCQSRGLMTGTDETHFNPSGAWSEAATREDMAVQLWRDAGSPDAGTEMPFADAGEVSEAAAQAVAWANKKGLITGKSNANLDPRSALTRAEAATILMRRNQGVSLLEEPVGANALAVMEDGSLLAADLYHKKIWRISGGKAEAYAGGDTVADSSGRPVGGSGDGALLESYFASPWAIAPYGDGWVVSDPDNKALRYLSGGQVRTITPSPERPTGLAADGEGNLYISDTLNGAVQKLDAGGTMTKVVEGLTDPTGLCWKNGALYIADTGANRIVKLEGNEAVNLAGTGEDGSEDGAADAAAFSAPTAVAVAEDGTVYVSDTGNSAIRRIRGGQVTTVAARDYNAENLRLVNPSGLLLQGNRLLVCDSFARTILELPVD